MECIDFVNGDKKMGETAIDFPKGSRHSCSDSGLDSPSWVRKPKWDIPTLTAHTNDDDSK